MRENDIVQVRQTSLKSIKPYILTALAIILSYILFSLVLGSAESTVRTVMFAGVILCGTALVLKRQRDIEHLILAVIIAGIIMRAGYMLYTPFALRGHDIGSYNSTGHYGYVYQLFSTGALPGTNDWQFYHPPLQHIMEALAVKLFSLFQSGADVDSLFQAAKIVPCFASCAVLWVSRRICEETGLSKRAAAIALTLIAFQPTFYVISSDINNDALMILLFMASVLYTIRWYHSPTVKNIVLTALCIGLAMMTKVSGGIVALFTAPLFLAMLIKMLREKKAESIIGQFAAFILVCVPLGLWYPVRNYIKFGQPFWYVLKIPNNSSLYCGNKTYIQRFLSFPIENIFSPLYCRPSGDYSLWLYTLKCSVFGEFTFDRPSLLAAALIAANLVIILISLIAMIYVMTRCKEVNGFARYGLFFIWIVQIVSFIAFNMQYPFGCTMDFRYIVPAAIVGAIYIGIALDHIRNKGNTAFRALYYAGCAAVCLFSAASVMFYTV
jgi:hypothetical protein